MERAAKLVRCAGSGDLSANRALVQQALDRSATLLRQLKDTGKLDLPKLTDPQPVWLNLLSRGLNLDTTLRVSLSGQQAEAWRQALIGQGVLATRMETGDTQAAGLHFELLR